MDWGSIASAGGSVVNGMLGYIANERTNEHNADLTRENWKWQKDMYELQLSDQERLYNKYNSPEAMRRQYELAGLNPYMMMKNGAQGQANITSSVPSSSPIPMHAYQPNIDLSPLAQYGLKDAQRDSLQASTDAQLIKNRFAVMRERFELEEKLASKHLTDTQRYHLERQIKLLDIESRYQEDFLKARNDAQRETANLTRNQALTEHYKGEYQQMVNSAFPRLNAAQLNLLASQSFSAYKAGIASQASANLSDEMKRHEAIKAIGSTIENGIKSGQFSAQQLGMSNLEIQALRDKRYLDWLKMSKINRVIDGIADVAGSIPASILKGLK